MTTTNEQAQTEALSTEAANAPAKDALTLSPDNYGPFWEYVNNDEITDADFNGVDLWITDTDGRRTHITDHGITSDFVRAFSQRVANKVSKPFNKMAPLLEAETSTLRISILHESAAVSGRSICLRKSLPNVRITAPSIIDTNYLPREIMNLLVNCIRAKMNFVIGGEPGAGKDLANDTLVPVPVSDKYPNGWARHGDLAVGDQVYAPDGSIVDIDYVTSERDLELYEVELGDGQVIKASGTHLWPVSSQRARRFRMQRQGQRATVDSAVEAEQTRLHTLARTMAPTMSAATVDTLAEIIGTSSHAVSRVMRLAGVPYTRVPGHGGPRAYPVDEALVSWADRRLGNAVADDARRMPLLTTMSTAEMAKTVRADDRLNWAVPVAEAIDGPDVDLPLDPYVLGQWLGDGHSYSGQITTASEFVLNEIVAAGFPVKSSRPTGQAHDYTFKGLFTVLNKMFERSVDIPNKMLKRIPAIYQRASFAQRLALFQGLMDSDGTIDKVGRSELCLTNLDLITDAMELARSLGIRTSMTQGPAVMTITDFVTGETRHQDCGTRYRLHFTTTRPVFRLPAKADCLPTKVRTTTQWNYIVDVRPVASEKGKCIRVNHPRHLYLVGGFVPTHNTELAKFLTQFIPNDQRVITIEDSPEWHFRTINPLHDCVEMRVTEEFNYAAAIKTCLRQNPKWIALSEARGEEAKWLITSWSTGVNGVTTIHTDDIRKIPGRLIAMMNDRNDAERMISDIYDFVNVAIVVRRKAMPDGTSRRYIDQMGFLYRDEDSHGVISLVHNGEFVLDTLPDDIAFRLERDEVAHPFESSAIDGLLGDKFTYRTLAQKAAEKAASAVPVAPAPRVAAPAAAPERAAEPAPQATTPTRSPMPPRVPVRAPGKGRNRSLSINPTRGGQR